MIVTLMAYAVLIAALLGLSALVIEDVVADLAWPRRWFWLVALAASLALPAWILIPGAPAHGASSVAPVYLPQSLEVARGIMTGGVDRAMGPIVRASQTDWFAGLRLNDVLLALWGMSSLSVLAVFGSSLVSLRRMRRAAQTIRIDGHDVLLLEGIGPAVMGFLRPRIALPGWLVHGPEQLRTTVLRHELEHVVARDQILLLCATFLVCLMPWNLPLWWQLRRLRAAIEVDCDARVLRSGIDALGYSEALLSVRERTTSIPLAAVTLTKTASQLERRIRTMFKGARQIKPLLLGMRLLAAAVLTACAVTARGPAAQPVVSGDEPLPIFMAWPRFPLDAILLGLTDGEVTVEYTVNTQGKVEDPAVIESSSPSLEDAALAVAQNYKYRPKLEDGAPVAVQGVRHVVEFHLDLVNDMSAEDAAIFVSLFGEGPHTEPATSVLESGTPQERVRRLEMYSHLLERQNDELKRGLQQRQEALDNVLKKAKALVDSGYLDDQLNPIVGANRGPAEQP